MRTAQTLSDRAGRRPGERRWTTRLLRALLAVSGAAILLGAGAALFLGLLGPLKYNYDAFAHLRGQFALAALGGALLLALGGAWRWAFTGGLVGVAGLIGLGPALSAPKAAPAACVLAEITVAIANVHDVNPDFDPLVQALLDADADILATAESAPRFWSATGPLRARYPYRLTRFPEGGRTESVMLWSKIPLRPRRINEQEPDAPGLALAEIDLGGERVAVAGLHAVRPVLGPQKAQFEGLAEIFETAPAARIVMGDFNATPWSHGMAVAEKSLSARTVPGLRRTWHGRYPNPIDRRNGWKPPAVIGNQIDHVLISAHFGVAGIDTFELPGSVHDGVKAALQLKRARCG